jgi:hypothetical protein
VKDIPSKEASKELGINYSTAKTILRVFRLEKRHIKKNKKGEFEIEGLVKYKSSPGSEKEESVKSMCYSTHHYIPSREELRRSLINNLTEKEIKEEEEFKNAEKFLPDFLYCISVLQNNISNLISQLNFNQYWLKEFYNLVSYYISQYSVNE